MIRKHRKSVGHLESGLHIVLDKANIFSPDMNLKNNFIIFVRKNDLMSRILQMEKWCQPKKVVCKFLIYFVNLSTASVSVTTFKFRFLISSKNFLKIDVFIIQINVGSSTLN